MNDDPITRLQQAALDGDFAQWVQKAVERFAKDYDHLDAAMHTEAFRQFENLYEDFVAENFLTDEGPNWVDCTRTEVELAMREDFKNTEKFRAAVAWSKNGSRCLSCGSDFFNKPIDLATLTEDACRTLVALYLMSLGNSVLLVPQPPDWNKWRSSIDRTEYGIAWMVDGIDGPSDDRFKRIGLVIDRVFAEWKVAPVEDNFLDITTGDLEASRNVNDGNVTVKFDRNLKAWALFLNLYQAGHEGRSREEIKKGVWPPNGAIADNNLDQQKAVVNKLIKALGVAIDSDNRGVWRLAELQS